MPLVEPPAVHHRQPSAVHLVEYVPQGTGGALEHAGVSHIKIKTGSLEQPPGVFRLLQAQRGQVDIGPAGEPVFQVPGGFAVANEYELVHGLFGAELGK